MRSSHISLLFALCTALLASACQSPKTDTPVSIVLQDVTVIDGTGASGRPNQVLVLQEGRVAAMGSVDEVEIPAHAEVLDFAGRYVIPGFVDLHVHFPSDTSVHEAMLARLLEYGVTTLLNPGARPGAGVELRQKIQDGDFVGPRMLTSGRIIDHDPTLDGLAHWAARVTEPEAIREEVRRQADAGVDWIKLYQHLPKELVEAAIDEAHALGLPVVGHMGTTTWGEAADLGIDMLVHSGWGTSMDEVVNLEDPVSATDTEWYNAYADAPNGQPLTTLIEALVRENVVVVPTLSITQASGLGSDASLLPLFKVELAPDRTVDDWWSPGWEERHPQFSPDSETEAELLTTVYFPGVLGILRAYFERGVRLGVGTDVGNSWMTPGYVYHHELALYQEAGVPPLQILTMATRNGAEVLGLLDETGTVEVGKAADLVVLGSDPSVDIRGTLDIEAVFLAGERVR